MFLSLYKNKEIVWNALKEVWRKTYKCIALLVKAVEDDFVEMRKNDPQSITADDLHQLLVVAR